MAVKDTAAKTKPLISKENAPKPYSGVRFWAFLRFGSKSAIGSDKEVAPMPRMPKYLKLSEQGKRAMIPYRRSSI